MGVHQCRSVPSRSGVGVIGASLLVLTGCAEPAMDLFHVEVAGTRLPVVIHGPANATTLVLFQHGGPDGNAGIDPLPPGLLALTDDLRVATWAQRSTTLAAGRNPLRDNTIAQHVEDLHAVRNSVLERAPAIERVVLAGHSWGVALTLAYLDVHGEAGLAGVVLSDGFFSYDDNAERSFARLAELATAQSADAVADEERDRWRETARFASEQHERGAPYPLETIVEASDACAELEGALDRPEKTKPTSPSLASPTSPLLVPDGLLIAWNFRSMIKELTTFDVSAGLADRRLPALLVWGKNDCRAPVDTGEALISRYGGNAELAIVDDATHFAIYAQPRAFAAPVRDFVAALP